ncbi:hypothetical protein BRD00_05685 [Halobacteriales archaeon QS_8_69_26]|nr:MAG: hypothetical protein BRD00_05685 [Halobacteriales archaeon QS_8_69_26]
MSSDDDGGDGAPLSPDEAFAVLGNEIRMGILRALADADGPLPFSELRERVGTRDSGQFNYHLGKLTGHFVRQTEEGYDLRRAGDRVIQAVLSGAITDAPVLDPVEVEDPCIHCGAPTVVGFREGYVRHYCTECTGTYGEVEVPVGAAGEDQADGDGEELGFLGRMALPPAGVQGRTPTELVETTSVWGILDFLAVARGLCPRCSAPVERAVSTCKDHGTAGQVCDRCDNRYAVIQRTRCTNCPYDSRAPFVLFCLAAPTVLAFLGERGVDPLTDWTAVDWTEDVEGTDPFEARFTCTVDGDAITLTVDDGLEVVDVATRRDG